MLAWRARSDRGCIPDVSGRQATGAAATNRRRKAKAWVRSERRVVRSQPVGGRTARPGGPSEPDQPCQTSPSRSTERGTKTRSARSPKARKIYVRAFKVRVVRKGLMVEEGQNWLLNECLPRYVVGKPSDILVRGSPNKNAYELLLQTR